MPANLDHVPIAIRSLDDALALRTDALPALGHRLADAGFAPRIQTYGSAFTRLGFPGADLEWLFLIEYLSPLVDPPIGRMDFSSSSSSMFQATAP